MSKIPGADKYEVEPLAALAPATSLLSRTKSASAGQTVDHPGRQLLRQPPTRGHGPGIIIAQAFEMSSRQDLAAGLLLLVGVTGCSTEQRATTPESPETAQADYTIEQARQTPSTWSPPPRNCWAQTIGSRLPGPRGLDSAAPQRGKRALATPTTYSLRSAQVICLPMHKK